MGDHSFKKGVEDAKKGNLPDPPKDNSLADYIFQSYRSEKQLEQDKEDYKRGYEAGSRQPDSKKK
jgi:hypothetical protein